MTSQFGALLRQWRRRAGLTQEQLAERSGVGVRSIRGLETGERGDPRLATVRLLAEALRLDPPEHDELLTAAAGPRTTRTGPPAEPAAPEPPVSSFQHTLADTADQLAQVVGARWRREEEQRQVQDPFPLPVRWTAAPERLRDHWANIHRAPAGHDPGALPLAGTLDRIAEVHRRVPSGRLVVLGRAGSGKTVLTLRFVLDLLADRGRDDPVPVIFGLASWNPNVTGFGDWLTGQLVRDFPGLGVPGPGGQSLAAVLVGAGRILPVLDGFDEMAHGLRRAALTALNATTSPLLLTSRPDEYAAAVDETDVLTAAAAVELCDLTVDDLAAYLPRTTRKAGWDQVLEELRERTGTTAARNVATVLSTPLMVGLARTVYSDVPGRDPAALLDSARFPTPESVEAHLFDNFVPAVYGRAPENARRWDPVRSRYWLGCLATHLDRLGGRDLAWWRFGDSLGGSMRMLVIGVVAGLVLGLTNALVLAGLYLVLVGRVGDAGFIVTDSLNVALAAGMGFALADGLMAKFRPSALEPSHARFRLRGVPREQWSKFFPAFRAGLFGGLAFGLGIGLVRGIVNWVLSGLPGYFLAGLVNTVGFGLVFGPALGVAYGTISLLESPLDIRSAASPDDLLKTNRSKIMRQLLVFGPTLGLVVALFGTFVVGQLDRIMGPLEFGLASALLWGFDAAIGGGLAYGLAMTAWGRWVVFARIWLPLTGRLPWAVSEFLDDAYRRGVLRRAGAVYQFRHARLHDHLSRDFAGR
ncbi:NACHT domain-containing protein [Amycolatopsis endophytica]|uniref:Transcriptional regulator with XRE-family HTH domain n=1 Tax=Amycolatopsis endophytica TaxID=860233 RepID=A0A853B203_9PSEU|nr:helix-turn-helix domain-containing protein [Amycolatopsis endophytica]NYI88811.1 transcriptional regulator with XRE-family HTH domain [Amycolatopsis endophytica]